MAHGQSWEIVSKGKGTAIWCEGGPGLSTSRDRYTGQTDDRDHGILKEKQRSPRRKSKLHNKTERGAHVGKKSTLVNHTYACFSLVAKSYPTPWSAAHQTPPSMGILQARILGWLAISFSRGSSWPRDRTHISWDSCIAGRFFTTEPPGKPRIYV